MVNGSSFDKPIARLPGGSEHFSLYVDLTLHSRADTIRKAAGNGTQRVARNHTV